LAIQIALLVQTSDDNNGANMLSSAYYHQYGAIPDA
jgi:hypothetical protein